MAEDVGGCGDDGTAGALEASVDQAVAACDGDIRAAARALLVTLDATERELEALKIEVARIEAAVSDGYVRGRLRHGNGEG